MRPSIWIDVFDHKWSGYGIAHTHTQIETQQAIYWARLAAKTNPDDSTTLIISSDNNWYKNPNDKTGPFPDSHLITLFPANLVLYDEPTLSPNPKTSLDINLQLSKFFAFTT